MEAVKNIAYVLDAFHRPILLWVNLRRLSVASGVRFRVQSGLSPTRHEGSTPKGDSAHAIGGSGVLPLTTFLTTQRLDRPCPCESIAQQVKTVSHKWVLTF